jgi:hypothetical protein
VQLPGHHGHEIPCGELARRGEAWGTSEARQMLEHAIETGRGGIYLRLTSEQFVRLRRPLSWSKCGPKVGCNPHKGTIH